MRPARTAFVWVLLVLAAANIYGLFLGLTQRAELQAQWPRLEGLWPLYLVCPVVTLVALAALALRKKWGFWLAVCAAVGVAAIELYAAGLAPHVMRVPIALGLLVAVRVPLWRELL